MRRGLIVAAGLCGVLGQQAGNQKAQFFPKLPMTVCSSDGQCETQQTTVTIDANWRWVHNVGGYTNCYTGMSWDATLCPNPTACAENCALENVPEDDYASTYLVKTQGSTLSLGYVAPGGNVGSRTYLMDGDEYRMFKLKNREFSFDVDVSTLPCGLNGALYFVEMDADGGMAKYPGNKAGAKYGTGYCDAQCPHDIKFINGEANTEDWGTTGAGKYGTCCTEMDIWESNSLSTAVTPHTCSVDGQTRCDGANCGTGANRYNGYCDMDGCDLNPWRAGNRSYYGPGSSFVIDTTKPFTVATAFHTSDGTDSGDLVEISRYFVQDGKRIPYPAANNVDKSMSSITDEFCQKRGTSWNETNYFGKLGGLKRMGDVMDKGMVLVMSLWDDGAANMLWLDSDFPLDANPSSPGTSRGSCPTSSGKPDDVRKQSPNAKVSYGNIKVGPITK